MRISDFDDGENRKLTSDRWYEREGELRQRRDDPAEFQGIYRGRRARNGRCNGTSDGRDGDGRARRCLRSKRRWNRRRSVKVGDGGKGSGRGAGERGRALWLKCRRLSRGDRAVP